MGKIYSSHYRPRLHLTIEEAITEFFSNVKHHNEDDIVAYLCHAFFEAIHKKLPSISSKWNTSTTAFERIEYASEIAYSHRKDRLERKEASLELLGDTIKFVKQNQIKSLDDIDEAILTLYHLQVKDRHVL